ncbi:MAG TPA: 3-hydroxyacyl-CoA dehydrogenase NAD-binding domain-containing protein [Syntrophomonas sp.]|nr:3-hydroxyacyl-CoA dehydrogenase NAD-binding domain-containing protein [Syntrophomonas sp.]
MKKIGVLGTGTMGAGIIQVLAQNGYEVVLRARRETSVQKGIAAVSKNLDRLVTKEKITAADRDAALARINGSTDISILADADFIIEAATEDMESKKALFAELDQICKPGTILATNTSSLSVTEIAAATNRPDKIVGTHFFNPVPIMKLVEIIHAAQSSDETVATAVELVRSLGKTTVEVKKDSPGFIVNRLLFPHMIEAARLLQEGVASVEDIDTAVKLGLNYPMGPFEMLDMGGLDLANSIMEYFAKEFNDNQYAAPLVIKQMVRAGKLGKKSGEGFYKY